MLFFKKSWLYILWSHVTIAKPSLKNLSPVFWFNQLKPLPSFHTLWLCYYKKKSCNVSILSCSRHVFLISSDIYIYMHVKAFLPFLCSPVNPTCVRWSSVNSLGSNVWQILQRGILTWLRSEQHRCHLVDKVQTWRIKAGGLSRMCLSVSAFLSLPHTHTCAHTLMQLGLTYVFVIMCCSR